MFGFPFVTLKALAVFCVFISTCHAQEEKICLGTDGFGLTPANIGSFKGCTTIDGDLMILPKQFSEDLAVEPEQLQNLSSVTNIKATLYVSGKHADFTSLSFLSNLQNIGNLVVSGTSLQTLGLRSLKSIEVDAIIQDNHHLCLAETIQWNRIISTNKNATMENNRSPRHCQGAKIVCSAGCRGSGCWGTALIDCQRF